jgi:hypothetical protein
MKCNILHFFLPYDIKFHSVNTLSKLETSIFSMCCGLHGNAADIKRKIHSIRNWSAATDDNIAKNVSPVRPYCLPVVRVSISKAARIAASILVKFTVSAGVPPWS